VSVRGKIVPEQGYWLAVKGDGASLYSFVNGAFHLLVQDATIWATGDTLRLEVRTVASNTARLMVYRNGVLLFTHDDASHFIASGQPGIGLYATTAIALDDWEGGTLPTNPRRQCGIPANASRSSASPSPHLERREIDDPRGSESPTACRGSLRSRDGHSAPVAYCLSERRGHMMVTR
jgi:hypothetical protein